MRELEADQKRFEARKRREYDLTHSDEKDQKVRRVKKRKIPDNKVVEVELVEKFELTAESPLKTPTVEQSGGEVNSPIF